MRKILLLLLGLLLPLAACGDDDDPIGPEPTGSLSFTFSGDTSGTFSVSGEPKLNSSGFPQNEFAVASVEAGEVFVGGFRPRGPNFDLFGIGLEGVTGPRTVNVCPQPTGGTCPVVFFLTGISETTEAPSRVYVLTSGSVTVSEMNAERVRGTFQGTGIYIDPTTNQPNFTRTITISNSQFNAPVMNDFGA